MLIRSHHRHTNACAQSLPEKESHALMMRCGSRTLQTAIEKPLRCFSSFDEAREERKRVVTNIETKAVTKRRTNLRLTLLVSFRGGGSCSPSLSSAQDVQTAARAQYEKA